MDKDPAASPTLNCIDEYCGYYRNLFSDVRSFEAFKPLDLGRLSSIPPKALAASAKVVRLANEQSLHHFLSQYPCQVQDLRNPRLSWFM
ncbi:hypothetical protein E5S67_04579 [Microcoleus sp. IPMA8]|uniref:Transposase n=1 Tax=Microcoleus asticus IPMA8 TaxID=2563858 RepID=A0ABX2D2I9_9CYAN|nr:hypothetical protein [Microcoleus asticus IPMA8]